MITLVEKLHDLGYIHCDIKPDNILIGDVQKDSQQINKLYLIDFGISESYLNNQGSHLPFKTGVPFKGNVIFSSKNAFAEV